MKKLAIAIASGLVICLAGVITYFCIPKEEKYELTLSAQDIAVEVGDSEEFSFNCSIKDAFIATQVEDKSIATIDTSEGNSFVHGHKVGTTKLTIIAKYKTQTRETVVDLEVVAVNAEPPEPPKENDELETPAEENAPSEEQEQVSAIEKPSTPEVSQDEEEQTNQLNLTSVMNCTTTENTVIVSDKLAVFSISVDSASQEGLVYEYDNTKLTVSLDENNAWTMRVKALEVGTFDLKITINGIEYVIKVERT